MVSETLPSFFLVGLRLSREPNSLHGRERVQEVLFERCNFPPDRTDVVTELRSQQCDLGGEYGCELVRAPRTQFPCPRSSRVRHSRRSSQDCFLLSIVRSGRNLLNFGGLAPFNAGHTSGHISVKEHLQSSCLRYAGMIERIQRQRNHHEP